MKKKTKKTNKKTKNKKEPEKLMRASYANHDDSLNPIKRRKLIVGPAEFEYI